MVMQSIYQNNIYIYPAPFLEEEEGEVELALDVYRPFILSVAFLSVANI
jgi:hypothetical protein